MDVLLGLLGAAAAFLIGLWLGRRRPGMAPSATERPEIVPTERPIAPTAAAAPTGVDRLDLERALADLRLGVVIIRAGGEEVYRNHRGQEYATGRHGDALVEAALERVVAGALIGLSLEESIEVYGPPARSFLVQASPIWEGDDVSGAVGVIEDITEARHNLRVRSDFVANVSHELRTPVGAMSVLAETIASADDPEVVDRLSQRMLREATRLADTIEDLLALAKLESGPISEPETIDLTSVATMAVERSGEAAAQRGVPVSVVADPDGPVLVDGDQGQLVAAVANLVDNAIKYSDPAGVVEVRLGTVDGTLAELSVADNGIGIPARDLERIFERFYRVDSGRSRETGGTGLGLSIVRHAVRNHRGTIDVESTEGHGSTFTLRFPLSASQTHVVSGPRECNDDRRSPGKDGTWSS